MIQAYVFDTEAEVIAKIDEINVAQGYPSAGGITYCSYEFNNNKWIVKYDEVTSMNEKFGYEPIFFEYQEYAL